MPKTALFGAFDATMVGVIGVTEVEFSVRVLFALFVGILLFGNKPLCGLLFAGLFDNCRALLFVPPCSTFGVN